MIKDLQGRVRVRASFDGDVDEVCVRLGEVVQAGERLVVVEGDHTLETLRAKARSEVLEVAVVEGDAVGEGALLLVLRELPAPP